MFIQQKGSWSQAVRQHRSIYRFGGDWSRTLLASVPWLNAVIIAVLLLAVHQRAVVTPGVVFDLPAGPLREGLHAGLTALMISVERDLPGGNETLIFFDDERYSMRDAEQMSVFSERVKSRVGLGARHELLLLADKRVPHGEVMKFVNVARDAGVQRVNVAEKAE